MRAARRITVPHPDDAIAAILGDSSEVPKALMEEAQDLLLIVGRHHDRQQRRWHVRWRSLEAGGALEA